MNNAHGLSTILPLPPFKIDCNFGFAGKNVTDFLTNGARRFPKAMAPVTESCLNNSQDLNQLRAQIWRLRMQFWYRKLVEYPSVINAAKAEAEVLVGKLMDPLSLTYREVGLGAVFTVHLYGAFCIGEIVGRQNLIGYDVKDVFWDVHNDEHEKAHHAAHDKKMQAKAKLQQAQAALLDTPAPAPAAAAAAAPAAAAHVASAKAPVVPPDFSKLPNLRD